VADVLIVDDDETTCRALASMVRSLGHDSTGALTLRDGLKEVAAKPYDVVFLDVVLPDGDGLVALPRFQGAPGSPEVIIVTGEGHPDGAELSIRSGAWDYIEKPVTAPKMSLPLARALQYREAKTTVTSSASLKLDGIVGQSPQMRASFDRLAEAARTDANVLITGETGTGKELFAWAIHNNSRRAHATLAVVDCAALPKTLVESVLFGHEKGAFTGADQAKAGLISEANEGTLFLDEVGELPLAVQSAFLRVLQERRFRPVGGDREVESNFRLVAATNRDLDQMTRSGQFREDLLFRLRTIAIDLPPLRERGDDTKALIFHFTAEICERYGMSPKGFSPEFLDTLVGHEWPGNVRELVNTLERAIAAAHDEPTLFPRHLPTHLLVELKRAEMSGGFPPETEHEPVPETPEVEARITGDLPTLKDFRGGAVADAETRYLRELVARHADDLEAACRISGLKQSRLYDLLKKHGIPRG